MDVGADADPGTRSHTSIMPHCPAMDRRHGDHGGVTSPRLFGLLAAAAAVAGSQLAAAVLDVRESPVVAIAQTAIRLTPGSVAEPIIGVVGTLDKPLAVASVVVAMLLLGALVGAWWEERRAWSVTGVVVLVVLAAAAVLTRPYGSAGGVLACVVGGAVLLGVLAMLHREPAAASDEPGIARRRVLKTMGLVLVGTAVAGTAGEVLASRRRRRRELDRLRASLRLPTRRLPNPPGVDLDVRGQQPWRTSNRAFYRIDTAVSPPLIDPASWRLRIHGMVERELTITYRDLLDRGLRDAWITLCCVSNPVGGDLISNTVFSGVPMRDLLDEAGVEPEADMLLSTSEDGWTCGTPLAALTDGRAALLAVAMDGVPLPVEHGFPVRQVVPGLYGYVSATKWVTDWRLTRFDETEAYWTKRGWSARGPVKTQSRIDVPRGSASAGTVTVAGIAWAQHTGIKRVEVRVDEGSWHRATLAEVPNVDTWVQWRWDWDARPGTHHLEVRATDRSGYTQTAKRADVVPDGATGYHGVDVTIS
jgi:DMSO/TMAO reductase YedYZ molybdopterin-dependent catalytic subunit